MCDSTMTDYEENAIVLEDAWSEFYVLFYL